MEGEREYPRLTITRLDAARRQIETATDLFFAEGDPVSIHTLAAAAHEIVRALCQKAGKPPLLKDAMLETIKPEYRNYIGKLFNQPRNFFKHAGTMQIESIEYVLGADDWLLYDAGAGYQLLTDDLRPKMLAFRAWFLANHHELLATDEMRKPFEQAAKMIGHLAKPEFYKQALEVFSNPDNIARALAANVAR